MPASAASTIASRNSGTLTPVDPAEWIVNVAQQAADRSADPRPPRTRRTAAVATTSAALLAIAGMGASWSAHRIQDDLAGRARAALTTFGVPDTVQVRYDGLDAVLTGTVQHPQQAADAIGAVVSVSGTRHVTSNVTLAAGARGQVAPAPTPSPGDTTGTAGGPGTPTLTPGRPGDPQLPAGKIGFATNDAALSAEARTYLDQVVTFLLAHPDLKLAIRGHSDNSGPDEVNWSLSKRRADAVVAYLVGRQVPAARLRPTAFAATVPVASNDTPDGRAANRRVELAIEESH